MPSRRRATPESTASRAAAATASGPAGSATASASGPYAAHAGPREHGSQLDLQLKAGAMSAATAPIQLKPKLPEGEEGFEEMWENHPHNYLDDDSENTTSDEVREEEGLPSYLENTCAIRMSVMFNKMGDATRITPAKTKAAGLPRKPFYSKKSKDYYILGASEMWTYIAKRYRKADAVYPKSGRWKNEEEFNKAFEEGDNPIKDIIKSKKGIVGMERIFGYGGTGHVDIFDGETLSDGSWYPCKRLHLWYVVP